MKQGLLSLHMSSPWEKVMLTCPFLKVCPRIPIVMTLLPEGEVRE